jgi:uracil-DNA glycosylase family 4
VTPEERRAALDAIASEVRVCERCRLAAGRTQAVPGEGDPETEVVFVGEGPGQNEDRLGRPFVGAAGELLEQLLGLVGWRREEVFITNVVKCRPPQNRDPEPDEISACRPYLERQLAVLDPALVVTLGRHSLQTFMPGARISQVHGTARPADPGTGARAATAYAMYHPAAALRQSSLVTTMQRDMAAIPETLIRARAARVGVTDEPLGADGPAVAEPRAEPASVTAEPPVTPDVLAALAPPTPVATPPSDDQLGIF